MLYFTDRTIEDKQLVGGCFQLYAERGVSMSLIVSTLDEEDMMVDWIDFCLSALRRGWRLGTAYKILREAIGDTYSPQWIKEWEEHMISWCKLRCRGIHLMYL